jgi:hypothetical protein
MRRPYSRRTATTVCWHGHGSRPMSMARRRWNMNESGRLFLNATEGAADLILRTKGLGHARTHDPRNA